MPINSSDRHADQFHFLDRGILDVPHWVQEPPVSLATSMQDHFPGINPDESLPLYDLYSPLQIREPWDMSLQDDMENIPVPSFPSNQTVDYSFQASDNSPLATRGDSIAADADPDTSPSPLEQPKALGFCVIMPKPPSLPSDAASDTNSDDVTQQGSAKVCRRRNLTTEEKEAAARVREIGSCARCIARKIKVSSE